MAVTNRERVGKAIDLLAAGLRPFVERELKTTLGEKWEEALADGAPRAARGKKAAKPNLADPQLLLNAVWNQWNNVFAKR